MDGVTASFETVSGAIMAKLHLLFCRQRLVKLLNGLIAGWALSGIHVRTCIYLSTGHRATLLSALLDQVSIALSAHFRQYVRM